MVPARALAGVPLALVILALSGCSSPWGCSDSTAKRGEAGVRVQVEDTYGQRSGITAEVVEMRGAVEVAPRMKIAHAICDLVSTGATLEANGMKATDLVLKSEAVLIKAPHAPAPELAHIFDMVLRRFDGVVASTGAKYVMLNAPKSHLAEITKLIPGADSPTIMQLAGRDDTVAVHAVCQENVFWETLDKLKAAGASAILVLPIEKMMK